MKKLILICILLAIVLSTVESRRKRRRRSRKLKAKKRFTRKSQANSPKCDELLGKLDPETGKHYLIPMIYTELQQKCPAGQITCVLNSNTKIEEGVDPNLLCCYTKDQLADANLSEYGTLLQDDPEQIVDRKRKRFTRK